MSALWHSLLGIEIVTASYWPLAFGKALWEIVLFKICAASIRVLSVGLHFLLSLLTSGLDTWLSLTNKMLEEGACPTFEQIFFF